MFLSTSQLEDKEMMTAGEWFYGKWWEEHLEIQTFCTQAATDWLRFIRNVAIKLVSAAGLKMSTLRESQSRVVARETHQLSAFNKPYHIHDTFIYSLMLSLSVLICCCHVFSAEFQLPQVVSDILAVVSLVLTCHLSACLCILLSACNSLIRATWQPNQHSVLLSNLHCPVQMHR